MRKTILISAITIAIATVAVWIAISNCNDNCDDGHNLVPGNQTFEKAIDYYRIRQSGAGNSLAEGQVRTAFRDFNECFTRNGINPGITFPKTLNPWSSFSPYFKLNDSAGIYPGITAHFVLINQKLYIAMAMATCNSSGITDNGIFINNVFRPDSFLLVKENSLMVISKQDVLEGEANYMNTIKIRPSDGTPMNINISGNKFPKLSYFHRKNFWLLYEDNNGANDGDFSGAKSLSVMWGAIYSDSTVLPGIDSSTINLLCPIFSIHNGVKESYQRIGNEYPTVGEPYDRKALDLGKLCPPDCTK